VSRHPTVIEAKSGAYDPAGIAANRAGRLTDAQRSAASSDEWFRTGIGVIAVAGITSFFFLFVPGAQLLSLVLGLVVAATLLGWLYRNTLELRAGHVMSIEGALEQRIVRPRGSWKAIGNTIRYVTIVVPEPAARARAGQAPRTGHAADDGWLCQYCQWQNDSNLHVCSHCGAKRPAKVENFAVGKAMYDRVQPSPHVRLYYLPKAREVVNVEPLPDR
jgi:hypothetical protein